MFVRIDEIPVRGLKLLLPEFFAAIWAFVRIDEIPVRGLKLSTTRAIFTAHLPVRIDEIPVRGLKQIDMESKYHSRSMSE